MTNREMAVTIKGLPGVSSAGERYGNQIEATCDTVAVASVLTLVKASGFEHLSNILAVDWIDDGQIELVYNLFSYRYRLHLTLKTRTDRDAPYAPTILSLWPQAQVYEREVHEFFGVLFEGNPNLEPFFLHNWQDMPPMRKDFDTEEYSRRAYGFLEDPDDENTDNHRPDALAGAKEQTT